MTDSQKIRKSIEKIARDVFNEMSRSCLRVYKAKVTTVPNISTGVCGVKLIGDDTEIFVKFCSDLNGLTVGEMVLVATTFDNLANGFIWKATDLEPHTL